MLVSEKAEIKLGQLQQQKPKAGTNQAGTKKGRSGIIKNFCFPCFVPDCPFFCPCLSLYSRLSLFCPCCPCFVRLSLFCPCSSLLSLFCPCCPCFVPVLSLLVPVLSLLVSVLSLIIRGITGLLPKFSHI